jgi:hypothetical protein
MSAGVDASVDVDVGVGSTTGLGLPNDHKTDTSYLDLLLNVLVW